MHRKFIFCASEVLAGYPMGIVRRIFVHFFYLYSCF